VKVNEMASLRSNPFNKLPVNPANVKVYDSFDKGDIKNWCNNTFTCPLPERCEDAVVCGISGGKASFKSELPLLILTLVMAVVVASYSILTLNKQVKLPDGSPGKSNALMIFSAVMLCISILVIFMVIGYGYNRVK